MPPTEACPTQRLLSAAEYFDQLFCSSSLALSSSAIQLLKSCDSARSIDWLMAEAALQPGSGLNLGKSSATVRTNPTSLAAKMIGNVTAMQSHPRWGPLELII